MGLLTAADNAGLATAACSTTGCSVAIEGGMVHILELQVKTLLSKVTLRIPAAQILQPDAKLEGKPAHSTNQTAVILEQTS